MFGIGLPVALLTCLLALRAPEPSVWRENREKSVLRIFSILWRHRRSFAYLLLVMSVMSCLSHGTQDLYPDFLKSVHGFSRDTVSNIAMLYNVCAIAGALLFGQLSERLGRRHGIMLALLVSLASLHFWAFGTTLGVLIAGSCFMQAGVQGAFGVIPAHLNELSPDAARSLFPGFVYQLGVLIASPAVSLEYALRDRIGYPWALTLFEGAVILVLIVIFQLGPERRGRSFHSSAQNDHR
ncbi:MAG TPA: MFS transporter, partial [Terriglobales bacterium]|nr:MFS transporter [Terriglobales bacterium]